MKWLATIGTVLSNIMKGAGYIGAFLFGRNSYKVKVEGKRRRDIEKKLETWQRRPRIHDELVDRLRDDAKRRD